MKCYLLIGLLLALTTNHALAQTANLTVKATNLKNTKGTCRYWLFRNPDGFPNEDKKAVKCVDIPVSGSVNQYVFENLPIGVYAVGVVHDENANRKMDTNFMGIPKEAYGVSNNVRGGISGPPKFEPASFTLTKGGTTVSIEVK
jgi:uncharacterized protein (DUF2141 family)